MKNTKTMRLLITVGLLLIGFVTYITVKIMKRSRGHINNNPFNLNSTGTKWQGETSSNDSRFEQFESLEMGIRAGYINLRNVYFNKGLTTPFEVISKYSPVDDPENPAGSTMNYAKFLANGLGIGIHDEIQDRPKAAWLMMRFENGYNIMDLVQFKTVLKSFNLV